MQALTWKCQILEFPIFPTNKIEKKYRKSCHFSNICKSLVSNKKYPPPPSVRQRSGAHVFSPYNQKKNTLSHPPTIFPGYARIAIIKTSIDRYRWHKECLGNLIPVNFSFLWMEFYMWFNSRFIIVLFFWVKSTNHVYLFTAFLFFWRGGGRFFLGCRGGALCPSTSGAYAPPPSLSLSFSLSLFICSGGGGGTYINISWHAGMCRSNGSFFTKMGPFSNKKN